MPGTGSVANLSVSYIFHHFDIYLDVYCYWFSYGATTNNKQQTTNTNEQLSVSKDEM